MNLLAVSFVTNDWYAKEAIRLEESVQKYNIQHQLFRYGSEDWGWNRSVRSKPAFILERLRNLSGEFGGLLYVDADAKFLAVPNWSLFDKLDVGAHWFKRRGENVEILTGTLFFRRSDVVETFVRRWIELTARVHEDSKTPEQDSIKLVVAEMCNDLRIGDFGPELCWVYDEFGHYHPKKTPVIEHYQASRKYRRLYP